MVSAKYQERAVDDFTFQVEFDESEIELGISPDLEGTTCNGWRITVPYYPRVSPEKFAKFQERFTDVYN